MIQHVIGYGNLGLWVLSVAVGAVFIVHGFSKIKNPKGIAAAYNAPAIVGLYHGLIEVLGGGALIMGIFTHFTALVLGIIMIGAIYFKVNKWNIPFMGRDKTGWEFDLVVWAACVALLLS